MSPLRRSRVVTLCLAVALGLASASDRASAAPADKAFTFTTSSDEARTYAAQIVRSIETFQFGPPVLEMAQKAVKADPNFAFGEYLLATFSATPEEVKAHSDRAVELATKASDGERRYIEAVLLVRANQADKALPLLKDLAAAYPGERMVQMILGQVLMNSGDIAGARAAFKRAVAIDPTTPRVYAFLGNTYLLDDDYKAAREYYTKSLEMKADATAPFAAYTGLAFAYVYERKWDDAIRTMEAFRDDYIKAGNNQAFPEVFIWNSIARMQLESGHPDLAIESYKSGYATIPGSSLDDTQKAIWRGRLFHGTGRALAKMGKPDEAWKQAETIKKMIEEGGEPGQQFWPSYHYLAGYLKYEAGNYKAAVEHMTQTDLTDPFHMLVLARAYEKVGDKQNARKWYQTIVDSKTINIERAISYPEAKKRLKAL